MSIILRIIIQFLLIPYIISTDFLCFEIFESVINLWLLNNMMTLLVFELFNYAHTG